MACPSLITRSSTRLALLAPVATGFSYASNPRIPGSGRMRPSGFLKASTPSTFRRCRIKVPAQFRVALLALMALLALSGCRQDMQNQPKFVPLRSSEFFPDQRSARYPVPGTVPRLDKTALAQGQLDPNSYFLTGKHGNAFGNELPQGLALNRALMERGQDRYNIYCTPC